MAEALWIAVPTFIGGETIHLRDHVLPVTHVVVWAVSSLFWALQPTRGGRAPPLAGARPARAGPHPRLAPREPRAVPRAAPVRRSFGGGGSVQEAAASLFRVGVTR